jgi:hypothetical protein
MTIVLSAGASRQQIRRIMQTIKDAGHENFPAISHARIIIGTTKIGTTRG